MDLEIGDIIIHKHGILRKIIEKRETGYDWIYLHSPDKIFCSENSNDEFFNFHWQKLDLENPQIKILLKMYIEEAITKG